MPDPPQDQIEPPIELYDRRLAGFDDAVWADADELAHGYSRLARDPAALAQAFDRALQCSDVKRLALIGPRFGTNVGPNREKVLEAARALSGLGRHTAASDLLALLGPPDPGDENHVLRCVGALVGLQRFKEARATVDGTLSSAPDSGSYRSIQKSVKRVAHALTVPEDRISCAEARAVANTLRGFGLEREAGRFMARILAGRAGAALGSGEERLLLAQTAIEVGAAADALGYLQAFPMDEHGREPWRTLVLAAGVLSGAEPTGGSQDDGSPEGKSHRAWRALAAERSGDLDGAIVDLCGMAEAFKHDLSIRQALARCVGKAVLAEVRPSFEPGRTGRLINLVTFSNEFELLRLHLEEMSPWVDTFVIVEAAASFTGHAKPLHFEANRALFKDFGHKIVHVPIRAFPEHLTSPWAREFYQRDMAIAGASGLCGDEDYILETDVDELVDGRVISRFEADFAALDLRLSRFFLNYRPLAGSRNSTHTKSSIFKARYRRLYGVSYSRIVLGGWNRGSHVLRDAGWHFTSVMDPIDISLKLRSYSHQEKKIRSTAYFDRALQRIRDGEPEPGWERVDLDDSFPASVRRNAGALGAMLI